MAQGILTHNWQPVGQALAQNVAQTMQQLFAGMGPLGGSVSRTVRPAPCGRDIRST